jgi:hypothetical protein
MCLWYGHLEKIGVTVFLAMVCGLWGVYGCASSTGIWNESERLIFWRRYVDSGACMDVLLVRAFGKNRGDRFSGDGLRTLGRVWMDSRHRYWERVGEIDFLAMVCGLWGVYGCTSGTNIGRESRRLMFWRWYVDSGACMDLLQAQMLVANRGN